MFLVRIFYIRTKYGDLLRKSPYSVQIQRNTDQKWLRIWTLFAQYDSSVELYNIISYSRFLFWQFSAPVFRKSAEFERNCKSTRFACLFWPSYDQCDMTNHPLTKYYYIIERGYFIYRWFRLFKSTFSFLLFLYTTSWRYKRDYLHTSINIVLYIMFYITNTMKKH